MRLCRFSANCEVAPVQRIGPRRDLLLVSRAHGGGGGRLKTSWKLCCVFMFFLSVAGMAQTRPPGQSNPAIYRHAYYLFLAGTPNGCEECYVPLLVTTRPLDEAAKGTEQTSCVLITTYERDSIWHNDGMVLVAPREIEAAPRIVQVRGRKYRYQEIGSAEVLKLFENAMGTIPISRPMLPNADSPGPTLEDLISDFRRLK